MSVGYNKLSTNAGHRSGLLNSALSWFIHHRLHLASAIIWAVIEDSISRRVTQFRCFYSLAGLRIISLTSNCVSFLSVSKKAMSLAKTLPWTKSPLIINAPVSTLHIQHTLTHLLTHFSRWAVSHSTNSQQQSPKPAV